MVKKYTAENLDVQVPEVEMSEVKNENRMLMGLKKLGPKKLSLIILIIVAISGVYGSFHFYNKYQTLKVDPNIETQKETARLVSLLEKLMELPKDEIPTIATISDKEKLKEQAFFTKAENGDILFAYTTAMTAILYRPSVNKIINVAPININQTQDITGGVKQATPTPETNTNQ